MIVNIKAKIKMQQETINKILVIFRHSNKFLSLNSDKKDQNRKILQTNLPSERIRNQFSLE
jgi:hypothetical protein